VEEFFNKEGFVTMKGRMKKKNANPTKHGNAAHLVKTFIHKHKDIIKAK
jgi:hypothetical protein